MDINKVGSKKPLVSKFLDLISNQARLNAAVSAA